MYTFLYFSLDYVFVRHLDLRLNTNYNKLKSIWSTNANMKKIGANIAAK
jgi:hypothetical protein